MATLRYSIALILGIALPYALQRWDRRRLGPEQQAAAWNGASWGAALYAFGPLSMLGWAWVTRQRFWAWEERSGLPLALLYSVGVLLAGLLVAVSLVLTIAGLDYAFALATGTEP
jgi:hypothetical protein